MARVGVGRASPLSGSIRTLVAALLAAIPVVLLLIAASSWVKVGMDLPTADDWRAYLDRSVATLDLGYLFTARNDTLYPVGQVLDGIANLTLGGNSVVYQLLSMLFVLGSLLAMQWTLLRLAFGDLLHTAIPFSLCGLMLLSGSYWGGPNVAYHQAVPLVAIMAALVLALRSIEPRPWMIAAGFGLGIIAGFTYISGAVGSVAAGGVMVCIGLVGRHPSRRRVLRVGAGLLAAGIVTTFAQVLAVRALQGDDSMAGNPLTFPWQPDFWYYIAGKIGASLGLPAGRPRLAIAITIIGVAVGIITVIWALRTLRHPPVQPRRSDVITVVLLSLAGTITAYLLLVGMGRSSLRPVSGDASPVEIFQFGFFRFHFFWVTLIWPWIGAAILAIALGIPRLRTRRLWPVVLAVAIALPVVTIVASARLAGGFDYTRFYERWNEARLEQYRCLLESVQRGDGHECMIWTPMNPAGMILYARSIDATWPRYLQTVPVPPAVEPFYSMHDQSSGSAEYVDLELLAEDDTRQTLRAGSDAQILIDVTDKEAMARCMTLELEASLRLPEDDVAQLFYRAPEDAQYSPRRVATTEVTATAAEDATVVLTVSSDEGFADQIRFDPVFSPQVFELADLELRCRWSAG